MLTQVTYNDSVNKYKPKITILGAEEDPLLSRTLLLLHHYLYSTAHQASRPCHHHYHLLSLTHGFRFTTVSGRFLQHAGDYGRLETLYSNSTDQHHHHHFRWLTPFWGSFSQEMAIAEIPQDTLFTHNSTNCATSHQASSIPLSVLSSAPLQEASSSHLYAVHLLHSKNFFLNSLPSSILWICLYCLWAVVFLTHSIVMQFTPLVHLVEIFINW